MRKTEYIVLLLAFAAILTPPSFSQATAPPMQLSAGTGSLVNFDGKGITLKLTSGGFSPKIPYHALNDADIKLLLQSPAFFKALFEITVPAPVGFAQLDARLAERNLEEKWRSGNTLAAKIAERMEIMEAIRQYHSHLPVWQNRSARVASASSAQDSADMAWWSAQASKITADTTRERIRASRDARVAERELAKAKQVSAIEAGNAGVSERLCMAAIGVLNSKGFVIPTYDLKVFPPFKCDTGIEADILKFRPTEVAAAEAPITDPKVQFHLEWAKLGSSSAQYALGMRYLKGDGVPRDEATGRTWLEKAAKQGNPDAALQLAKISTANAQQGKINPSP